MSNLFGLTELLDRRAPPEEPRIVAGLRKTTDAVIAVASRQFSPALRAGEVWCDRCGQAMGVERVKAHRCEGG